ncbi:MAG TPA: hypothetical protein VHY91_04400 [Pirellulales bacterium]|jgi:hypothetical protein|nr:hypothetical protein [Pirellulales bacterium]
MSRSRLFLSRLLPGMRGIIATICITGLGTSPAAAAVYGSLEVVTGPQPSMEGGAPEARPGGYIEYRIEVRNFSKTVDHRVRLVHPTRTIAYYDDYLERNSRTVRVPHESKLLVSLFQPALPVFDESLAVEIDGIRQKELIDLPTPLGRGFGTSSGARPCLIVLSSRGIPQELKDDVRTAHPNEVAFCRSELPVDEWSPNWLGYTAYDALLITEQEAASLPPDVLLAIRRYAETGGIVLVQGSSTDPKKIVPEGLRDADAVADTERNFHVGFGLVRPCPATTPWPGEFWTAIFRTAIMPTDRSVQVVGDVDVPVRGLLVVVIFFAVGIGPVNVWLLSRRRKRMWLWWDVPAVSLATCLAVFAYSLFAEGISGHGRIALITLLDENTHRATSLGYASFYCPLTPSNGLHFSYDTEVVQLHTNEARGPRLGGGRPKTMDWTNDQHLDSGWVLARVPACFAVRKSETRRERLAVHKGADGAIKVVNGLGIDLDSLYYVAEDGAVGVASEVPAGEERTLETRTPVGKPPADGFQSLRGLFTQPWHTSLDELRKMPEKFVAPGCYVAVVRNSTFMEDPLEAAPQEGSIGVIYGIGARSDNGR